MVLSFFGGLLFGSGVMVLFSSRPPYPKPIGAVFVIVGIMMMAVGIAIPALW